jgi:crossover junction endodeoxyribonuclease RusA
MTTANSNWTDADIHARGGAPNAKGRVKQPKGATDHRVLRLTVYGTPGPQGSKSFKGLSKSGKAILIESSKKVLPWRQAVQWAVIESDIRALMIQTRGMFVGPVFVDITFTLRRPQGSKAGFPGKRPDLDKLCRSTLDALTDAGAIEDDSRVVELFARKVFPGSHPNALGVPGAIITIEAAH